MVDLISAAIAAAAPHANVAQWVQALTAPMQASGITTPHRVAMFLGQVIEETGGFRVLSEDLYYTTAQHIRDTWPSHFADAGEAAAFIGKPAALANHVYANRMGNGPDESGDGWRYRGRGLIQLTGKTLYQQFAKVEPRASDPDWLLTPAGAAASACWYWTIPTKLPSLNSLSDDWDLEGVTRRINGGLLNLQTRQATCGAALAAIGPQGFGITKMAKELGQNPQKSASLPGDLSSKELTPESDADRLMDAELNTMHAAQPA